MRRGLALLLALMGVLFWALTAGRDVASDVERAGDAAPAAPRSVEPFRSDAPVPPVAIELPAVATANDRTPVPSLPAGPPTEGGEPGAARDTTATVTGVVLDPDGRPVAGAAVQRAGSSEAWNDARVATTAADGTFTVDGLAPGAHFFGAEAEGWFPAERPLQEVRPGGRYEVTLRLRAGGALAGSVVDGTGAPHVGWKVSVRGPHLDEFEALTDAIGAFRFDGLEPGEWNLAAAPADMEERWLNIRWAPDSLDYLAYQQLSLGAAAEVRGGRVTEVQLGGVRGVPVQLQLRVTTGEEAAPGLVTTTMPWPVASEHRFELLRTALTDARGVASLELAHAGLHRVTVQTARGLTLASYLVVPEVAVHEFELELPGGAISGRVTGPDGEPGRFGVRLEALGHGDPSAPSPIGSVEALVDANVAPGIHRGTASDGSFTFDGLGPGAYRLLTDSSNFFLGDAAQVGTGSASRFVELAAGERLSGMDLRLAEGGSLRIKVLGPDGEPVRDAEVRVEDGRGGRLDFGWTFGDGECSLGSFCDERVWVSARSATGSVLAARPVDVVRGESVAVELTLAPAALIRLVATSGAGESVPAEFTVVGPDGTDWRVRGFASGLPDLALPSDGAADGLVLGPLPAGRYEVTAQAYDGRRAARTIRIEPEAAAAGAPLQFELRLP